MNNPILIDSRVAKEAGRTYGEMIQAVSTCFEATGHYITMDWERVTDEQQINKARVILSRLANLESR